MHRLGQFGFLSHAGAQLYFSFGKFVGRDKVDWPDPFPIRNQAVHRSRFLLRAANLAGGEGKALGQDWRRTLKALARNPRHFDTSLVFILGASDRPRARLAGASQCFLRGRQCRICLPSGLRCSAYRRFRAGEFFTKAAAERLALFDLLHQSGRLGGDNGSFGFDFVQTSSHLGKTVRSVTRARLPALDIAALRGGSFPCNGKGLVVSGERGGGGLQCRLGRLVFGPRGFQSDPAGARIGQRASPAFSSCEIRFRAMAPVGEFAQTALQFRATGLVMRLGIFGLVDCTQRVALGVGRARDGPFSGDD